MSLNTLIADTRNAITDEAANAHLVFAAQGTLVGVTEVDISTGAHTSTWIYAASSVSMTRSGRAFPRSASR